jgi:hypothetical protein
VDTKTSAPLFSSNSEAMQRIEKARTICLEEIEEELKRAYPGQDKDSKTTKTDLVHAIFETRSWTKVSESKLPELERGLAVLRGSLPLLKDDASDVYAKVAAVKADLPVPSDENPFADQSKEA